MEPFKNNVNAEVVRSLAAGLGDPPGFEAAALDGLESLELKARIGQIADALGAHLEEPFPAAVERVLAVSESVGMWAAWPLATWIERSGLEHWDASWAAMKRLTERASCEFAVRPFIRQDPPRALATLREWTTDPNEHVRRLVSEGTRPRLPWGGHLRMFQRDPAPTLALLERLRADPAEYVRRSVGNHLNDITKDNPDAAVETAGRWHAEGSADVRWVVRRGLRGLVKQGHPGALAVLGLGTPQIELVSLTVSPTIIALGSALEIRCALDCAADQALLIDYAVHHVKANGTTTPKVFKWAKRDAVAGQRLSLTRQHAIKPISTRRYYSGTHAVELRINGCAFGRAEFELRV